VVHLAAQDLLPPRALLGGSDRIGDRRELFAAKPAEVDEARGAQPEWAEDTLMADPVEWRLRDQLDELPEQQEAEVAVHGICARRVFQALSMDLLVHELARAAAGRHVRPSLQATRDLLVERTPRGQAGAMRQQVA